MDRALSVALPCHAPPGPTRPKAEFMGRGIPLVENVSQACSAMLSLSKVASHQIELCLSVWLYRRKNEPGQTKAQLGTLLRAIHAEIKTASPENEISIEEVANLFNVFSQTKICELCERNAKQARKDVEILENAAAPDVRRMTATVIPNAELWWVEILEIAHDIASNLSELGMQIQAREKVDRSQWQSEAIRLQNLFNAGKELINRGNRLQTIFHLQVRHASANANASVGDITTVINNGFDLSGIERALGAIAAALNNGSPTRREIEAGEPPKGSWVTAGELETLSGVNRGVIYRAAVAGDIETNGKDGDDKLYSFDSFHAWHKERANREK